MSRLIVPTYYSSVNTNLTKSGMKSYCLVYNAPETGHTYVFLLPAEFGSTLLVGLVLCCLNHGLTFSDLLFNITMKEE
jgi:hypothetical protein